MTHASSLRVLALAVLVTMNACKRSEVPQTTAAKLSGYTYVPIDPQAVETTRSAGSCAEGDATAKHTPLLDSLPDNTERTSVEQFNLDGSVSYGVGNAAVKLGRYRVTTDYINSDTVSVRLCFKREVEGYDRRTKTKKGFVQVPMGLTELNPNIHFIGGAERFTVNLCETQTPEDGFEPYSIPVYVGIGLRVTATVNVGEGSASISGLGALGVEAEAKRLRGDLVLQTLGVNGDGVTAAIPINSELNQTTVMNAVTAIGAIKALLRDHETIKSPRLVGLYLPFRSDQRLVNAIISALSIKRVKWDRPCGDVKEKANTPLATDHL